MGLGNGDGLDDGGLAVDFLDEGAVGFGEGVLGDGGGGRHGVRLVVTSAVNGSDGFTNPSALSI